DRDKANWNDITKKAGFALNFVPYKSFVAGRTDSSVDPESIMLAPRTRFAHEVIARTLSTAGLKEPGLAQAMVALYGGDLDRPVKPGGDLQEIGGNRYFAFGIPGFAIGSGEANPLDQTSRNILQHVVNGRTGD